MREHQPLHDERSSVVYRMPRTAKELGAAVEQIELSGIATRVCQLLDDEHSRVLR